MTKNKKKGFVLAYGYRGIKSTNGKKGKVVEAEKPRHPHTGSRESAGSGAS